MSLQKNINWSQPVIFKAEKLIPVIEEALKNKCRVLLVQCHGLFFMSEKGETRPDGRWVNLAYGEGFNPDDHPVDDYDYLLRVICGGSDFCESVTARHFAFRQAIEKHADVCVRFTPEHFQISSC
ncbi:DUF3085 domain-containing protein [Salmonella enterica]|nr:DUF3085 domain-containing protein [Salmonella enterica]EAX6603592.1 DUF3085 domain-containing protein [Salmonella enterica]